MNNENGNMPSGDTSGELPRLEPAALVFAVKSTALQVKRALRNVRSRLRRYPKQVEWLPEIVAESRSRLWSESDAEIGTSEGFGLQLGKVQNLRCAACLLNGVSIPSGAVFSFWKHVGRATRRRGFAEGRLLREGCLIPATGGGLCQLSNALYDAALEAELQIVERWPHSRIIPGSAAERGRDATVAWNYIDLRFRSRFPWQIEIILTETELVVRLRGPERMPVRQAPSQPEVPDTRIPLDPVRHSCSTCGVEKCFRHIPKAATAESRSFYIVDEYWPEFQAFLEGEHCRDAGIAMPLDGEAWNRPRYRWNTRHYRDVVTATLPALRRSRRMRRLKAQGAERLQAELEANEQLAIVLAKRLPPDALHLVVAQPFLPWLWRNGFLGGRSFDVLMTQMPLQRLHGILDGAHRQHPERETLAEYRAPHHIVQSESEALAAARRVVTPHSAIAALFPERAVKIPWQLTARRTARRPREFTIGFPGPTAARKGAYELRAAARVLDAEVVLYGNELEGIGYWAGIRTRQAATTGNRLDEVSAVVQPALVENAPRSLLSALASGVPVIATPACGLDPHPNLIVVPPGDEEALIQALSAVKERLAPPAGAPSLQDIRAQT